LRRTSTTRSRTSSTRSATTTFCDEGTWSMMENCYFGIIAIGRCYYWILFDATLQTFSMMEWREILAVCSSYWMADWEVDWLR
jgi:hypothetical protein